MVNAKNPLVRAGRIAGGIMGEEPGAVYEGVKGTNLPTITGGIIKAGKGIKGFINKLKHTGDVIAKTVHDSHKKMPSMHKGGIAKKTAPHMLHKGEMVIPAHVVKKIKTVIKK